MQTHLFLHVVFNPPLLLDFQSFLQFVHFQLKCHTDRVTLFCETVLLKQGPPLSSSTRRRQRLKVQTCFATATTTLECSTTIPPQHEQSLQGLSIRRSDHKIKGSNPLKGIPVWYSRNFPQSSSYLVFSIHIVNYSLMRWLHLKNWFLVRLLQYKKYCDSIWYFTSTWKERRYRWIFKNKNLPVLLRGCQCIYEIRKFKLKIASVLTASFSARRPQYDFCWVEWTKTPSQFYVQYSASAIVDKINWLSSRLSQAYLWGSSADWCCAHEDTRVCLFQRIERLYMTWGIWSLLHQFFCSLEILAHT